MSQVRRKGVNGLGLRATGENQTRGQGLRVAACALRDSHVSLDPRRSHGLSVRRSLFSPLPSPLRVNVRVSLFSPIPLPLSRSKNWPHSCIFPDLWLGHRQRKSLRQRMAFLFFWLLHSSHSLPEHF